jgi:DNA-binding IclR family transcriptional regulator
VGSDAGDIASPDQLFRHARRGLAYNRRRIYAAGPTKNEVKYAMRKLKSKSAPVGVIGKVFRILELLDHSPYGLQLGEIATKTGINKSTAHRFLRHLEADSYLFRDTAGTYMLGARLARLGTGVSFQTTLCRICRPTLESLRAVTDETVNLAALEGSEIVYLDVLESQQMFRFVSPVGTRRPAYCTSLGKAIIAHMEDERQKAEIVSSIQAMPSTARKPSSISRLKRELKQISERGFSFDDEEVVAGARCVGAALFGAEGSVVGSISVSGPVSRMTRERLSFFSTEVCKAAREISWRLGHRSWKGERTNGSHVAGSPRDSGPDKRSS